MYRLFTKNGIMTARNIRVCVMMLSRIPNILSGIRGSGVQGSGVPRIPDLLSGIRDPVTRIPDKAVVQFTGIGAFRTSGVQGSM